MRRTFSNYWIHYLLNRETDPPTGREAWPFTGLRAIEDLTVRVKEILEIPDLIPSYCVGWRHLVLRRGSDFTGGRLRVPNDEDILASTGFSYLGKVLISELDNDASLFKTFTSTGQDLIEKPNPDYRAGHAVRTIGETFFELGPYDQAVDIDNLMRNAA